MNVRAMTFNIRNGKAPDGENRWERRASFVCDVIRDAHPDVLGMQEAFRFQLDDMGPRLPDYAEIGTGRKGGTDGEYAAILYRKDRFSLVSSGTFWLSETPDRPSSGWGADYNRICTWVQLRDRDSGAAFYVYNVHMDHKARAAQVNGAGLLLRKISEREHRDPVILLGDFNVDECDEIIAHIRGDAALIGEDSPPLPLVDTLRSVHPNAGDVCTYHAFGEQLNGPRIDYIFAGHESPVTQAEIIRTQRDGRFPSDHYPVSACLDLKPCLL